MKSLKNQNSLLIWLIITTFFAIMGCGGANDSSGNQNSGGDVSEKILFVYPDLSIEYKGEIKGTLSGDLNEDYLRDITILFTPRRQYYLRTMTAYIGSSMNEGEINGILKETERGSLNETDSIHEVVDNKEKLFVGNTFFSILLNNNSMQLKSTAGSTKILNVSNERFSAEVDITLEGKNLQNQTIQASFKGRIDATQQSPTLYYFSNIIMDPITPNELLVGDSVYIDFNYYINKNEAVKIFAEPSVKRGTYSYLPLLPYKRGEGKGQVNFSVYSMSSNTATIDSFTLLMISDKRILNTTVVPVSYTFYQ